jgi:bifunctional non-homologous end joining protein LigD
MLLLRKEALPADAARWEYQLKLDGFRAVAYKSAGNVHLRSRNNKDFNLAYPRIVRGLAKLSNETVIDGEIVAVDAEGRPSFGLLQNANAAATILFYVFDVMILAGRDVMREPLSARRALLEAKVLPKLAEPVRHAITLQASLATLIESVKAQGFEGLVAKRLDSRYEPGQRSGAWQKMRVNQGQEFVIGGYTIGGTPFDALIFGYYEKGKLLYAARTRAGFTPAVRAQLMKRLRPLETPTCPFANLPERLSGRWGQGLTAAKMKDCCWLKPVLVGQFEFLEWTVDSHLRHSKFVALREDKAAKDVRRE